MDKKLPPANAEDTGSSLVQEDSTLARDGVSREVPCSALKGETVTVFTTEKW